MSDVLSDLYLRIPLESIHVNRDARQRREIETSDLEPSIRLRGVIVPIIVERSKDNPQTYTLIAGERRLEASRRLNLSDIPARLGESLSSSEREILELEENIKRKALPWQDEARAFRKIHQFYVDQEPGGWSQAQTAEIIGVTQSKISESIRVANELDSGNRHIAAAPSTRAAANVIARRDSRVLADVMEGLFEKPQETVAAPESILQLNFHTFAESYSGPGFNLLHCDFPYGIDHDKSAQGGSVPNDSRPMVTRQSYEDSEETYWALCETLVKHRAKLLAESAHIIFWLSSDIRRQHATLTFFAQFAPDLDFQPVPIIWLKTDNRGILPDPQRGPRRIYETALIASRGDRLILRAVSNAYGAPTSKEIHQSEKPEPMLKHFFQMFVDENTRLLDPTCGSGTALRAAEALGAKEVLGLEIQEEFVEAARAALKRARILRNA